jgi:uncharacterized protein YndB with AHSA1/START domain
MNITEKTAQSQTSAISFEVDLHHTPTKVWRALTDPVLLAEWLLPVIGLELDPGAAFTFKAPPQPDWDGIVNCQLLEADPPARLSYTWVAGDIDTVVTFTLVPTTSGTLLSIVHSGFKPDQKRNFNGARYGWKMMCGKLVNLFTTSQPLQ